MMKRTEFSFQLPGFNLMLSGLALLLLPCTWHPAPALAQMPSGTPVYSVNAKWVTDRGSQVFNVMAYGAKCDGVTDDAAGIQAAINAANPDTSTVNLPGAGMTLIPGGCAIGSTLTLRGILSGTGIGTPNKHGASSYLKWIGSAGQPMVLITTWKASVRDLAFIGNSAAPPSEAIQISTYPNMNVAFGDMGNVRDVMIGAVGSPNPDPGKQFVNGITWNGTTGGDSWWISDVHITGCTGNGINNPNPNAADMHIENLYVSGCAAGFYGKGEGLYGTNWEFGNNTIDLSLASPADVNIHGFVGGASGQFIVNNGGRLVIDGGNWMPTTAMTTPNFIDNSSGQFLKLENFILLTGNYNGLPAILACPSNGSDPDVGSQYLGLIDVSGFTANMISCPTTAFVAPQDNAVIEFRPRIFGSWHTDTYNIFNRVNGAAGFLDWSRHDNEHQYNFWGGPIELLQTPDNLVTIAGCTPTGSGSSSYGYRVTGTTGQKLGSISFGGETLPSTEVTCANGSTLNSTANYNTLRIFPAPGATGVNVYCRTPGGEQLCTPTPLPVVGGGDGTISWVDNGSAAPSGALPTANTTGRLVGGNYTYGTGWTQNLDIGADGHGNFQSLKIAGSPATMTIASGTAALGTSSVGSGVCASVVSVAASSVLTTDTIKFTPNADPTGVAGYGVSATGAVLSVYAYPTAGYVNFKVCNSTSAAIVPGALTLNWEVTR